MQQILYEQSPYIVTDYEPDLEAYNTDKWEGYIRIPDPNGNALLPPFGNGGIRQLPEHRAEDGRGREEGSGATLWIAIVAAVVVVAIVAWPRDALAQAKALEE